MTTIAPPTFRLPSLREIRTHMDSSVLKTLIVCATIAVLGIVGGLVCVALYGGDVGPIGTTLTSILSATLAAFGATKWMQRKGGDHGSG